MSKQNSNNKTFKGTRSITVMNCAVPIAVFVFLVGGMGVWFARSSQQSSITQVASQVQPTSTNQETVVAPSSVTVTLTPAPKNWQETTHVHGLAVNPDNPEIAYVATHHGLLQRSQAGEWFWMGKERADYMGFTADPTNPNRFYSSRHLRKYSTR